MHEVMLRSLPVSDPGSLYRIGSGNECCIEGGPQDNWGMFSYPLFERLRIGAGRLIEAQLYGVTGSDPMALSVAVAALAGCAFAAAIIPALRAASIDPIGALRSE
jgi:hypothetical protein